MICRNFRFFFVVLANLVMMSLFILILFCIHRLRDSMEGIGYLV